jgi:dual-specificity kinase
MMEVVMGRMPDRFARSGARAKPEYFKDAARLDWPKAKSSRQSKKDVRACKPIAVRVSRHFGPRARR